MDTFIFIVIFVCFIIFMYALLTKKQRAKKTEQDNAVDSIQPTIYDSEVWEDSNYPFKPSSPAIQSKEIDLTTSQADFEKAIEEFIIDIDLTPAPKKSSRKKPVPPTDRVLKENEKPKVKKTQKGKSKRNKK